MSIPANPLDDFITYTYHFELHASESWDKLKHLLTEDENAQTTRFMPGGKNNTLLINTRKDAHQHIDDVRFVAQAEDTAKTELFIPTGVVSLTIDEPGGFSFVEKLASLLKINQTTTEGMTYVLKILFVGRTAENKIVPIPAKIIPMVLIAESSAVFTEAGGKYTMTFTPNMAVGAADTPASGVKMSFGFVKRAVSFAAGTVEEALRKLESHLNSGYEEVYRTEGVAEQGKKLVYKITFDPEIKGRIDSLNKDSLDPAEPSKFVFSPTLQIASFIHSILKKCPTLQKRIGESKS